MNPDARMRKFVQVAEQADLPIHVPVVLGNECIIITQQDLRRIEDCRMFSYHKINSKGELVPMDAFDCHDIVCNGHAFHLRQHNAGRNNQINTDILMELIERAYNELYQQQIKQTTQIILPDLLKCIQMQLMPTMAVTSTPTPEFAPATATLQQQLDWAKACETITIPNTKYPLHHTSATSTTEISQAQWPTQSNATRRKCCSRACNTMDIDEALPQTLSNSPLKPCSTTTCLGARQQAKQRKIAQFGN